MQWLFVATLLLALLAFVFATEIDVDIRSRVSINNNANVINRRNWYVVDGPGYVVGGGVSRTRAPGFREIDAMFAGLTLVRQCSLGFAWFEKSTDLSVDSSNDDSVTIQSSASAFGFFGRFWAIIEYLDTNGVPGYQPGDTILSLYPLSRNLSDWKPIKRDTLYLITGEAVYVVTVQTVDEVFGLQVFIAPRPILVDGSSVDQDGVKIAIEINYYNYSGASSDPNAKIALAVLVGAARASSFRNMTIAEVDIPSDNPIYRGYQHWDLGFRLSNRDGSASRSGSVQSSWEVQFSNISQIQGQFQAGWVVSAVYFSFGVNETRPGHIWWDPGMGAMVNYDQTSVAPQLTPTVFILLFTFITILINKLNTL